MSNQVKIDKIHIQFGDAELTLTIEQARQLYHELKTVFEKEGTIILPVTYPYPYPYRYYPNYPEYPIITVSSGDSSTGTISTG